MPRRSLSIQGSSAWGKLTRVGVILLIGLVCGLPLANAGWLLATHPALWADVTPSAFRIELLGRTLLYNGSAALIACAMGLPVGVVLARSRGVLARVLWLVVPLALLMPSMAFTYGWSQVVRLSAPWAQVLGVNLPPAPGSTLDVARCVWTIAAYLWAIPAVTVGLMLRRTDPAIELHAALDGALTRTRLRLALPALTIGFAAVLLLAGQEFAVYEPTGISVIATEVRMVFDSGAFSSLANPATASVAGGGITASRPDQAARSASAIATALPLLALSAGLAVGISILARRQSEDAGELTAPPPPAELPAALEPSRPLRLLAALLVVFNVAVPVAALCVSLRVRLDVVEVWEVFSPAILGTLAVGAAVAAAAAVLSAASTVAKPPAWLQALAIAAFLVGGQLLAIAVIRLANRPGLEWAYDSALMPIFTDLARFAFLGLAAGAAAHAAPFKPLRQLAALDGAGPLATARYVVLPLAWPVIIAAALLTGALAMTEVPATVLLSPQNPQMLVPLLVTWVHMLRYDPMIQASLLMMALAVVPGAIAVALLGLFARSARATRPRSQNREHRKLRLVRPPGHAPESVE